MAPAPDLTDLVDITDVGLATLVESVDALLHWSTCVGGVVVVSCIDLRGASNKLGEELVEEPTLLY